MTALRTAAQQAPVQEPVCAHGVGKTKCSFCSVEDKQPVQEPVAGRAFFERILAAMEGVIDVADRKTDEFDALRSCVIDLTLMLHTAPPQRKPLTEERNFCSRCGKRANGIHTCTPPAPLTDEVIAELWHQNGGFHHHFARAIERWLKGNP